MDLPNSGTSSTDVFSTYSEDDQNILTPVTSVMQTDGELPFEAADLEDQGRLDGSTLRRRDVRGLHRVIFNFTPQWFLVTMGTGNVALIMVLIPLGQPAWLYWLTVVVFALDVFLFLLFLLISLIRYTMYPKLFPVVLWHPVQALYLGPFTVSLASIINLMVHICLPAWGTWMINWIWALWWVDVVLAVAVEVGVMFCMFRYHNHTHLDQMMSVWLLPSISPIVASASSATVATVLPPAHAVWTVTLGYILWGMGVPMAMLLLAMYLHRLSFSHNPPAPVIFSVFLPLGPLAQGAHAIVELGKDSLHLIPATNTLPRAPDAGTVLYVIGWLTLTIFWAFAAVWLCIAVVTLVEKRRFPFNMSWWSVIFPTGVFALVTMQLGNEVPSLFFKWLGTVFTGMNVALWLVVCALTVRGVWNGSLFGAGDNSRGGGSRKGVESKDEGKPR